MQPLTLDEQLELFRESYRELNILYEEYAKSVGLSYTSLQVLDIIHSSRHDCTQKTICLQAFLPKQTVNSIITGFLKQGLLELREIASDRRNKTIHFTASGQQYAEEVLLKLKSAERGALTGLDAQQREALVGNTKQFKDNFRKCISPGQSV